MRLQDLAGIAIIFVVVAIVISIGADVLTEVQVGKTVSTVEYNASQYGLEGLEELASWLPTIAIIVAAAVIIGIIVLYFAMR
jgi:hypothetical protein